MHLALKTNGCVTSPNIAVVVSIYRVAQKTSQTLCNITARILYG